MAVELDWLIPSSRCPFGGETGEFELCAVAQNWAGAAFKLALKQALTDTSPAIEVTNVSSDDGVITATYDAEFVSPATGQISGATIIRPLLSETALETTISSLWGSNAKLEFFYDLSVTPAGGQQRIVAFGRITINRGVGD